MQRTVLNTVVIIIKLFNNYNNALRFMVAIWALRTFCFCLHSVIRKNGPVKNIFKDKWYRSRHGGWVISSGGACSTLREHMTIPQTGRHSVPTDGSLVGLWAEYGQL